jgi:hypothetical protein
VVRRVLVALDGEDDLPLVAVACDLARRHNARLELVGGVPRLWCTAAFVACPAQMQQELEGYAKSLLRQAVDRVPCDLPVVMRLVQGSARRTLLRERCECGEEIVVTRPCRHRRRARSGEGRRTLLEVPASPLPV